MNKVVIYSSGIVCCSVCVEKDLSREEIIAEVNQQNPTMIKSQWNISEDTHFAGGTHTNPCICKSDESRLHYLMVC